MGQVFAGRYELVDLLGRGGSGDVWRVWDHRAGAYRAAKLLRQADSAGLLRFVRESATRIEHPHVLAPTGWAGEDEHVLIVMPVVGGGSVAQLVADHGALPATWVRTLMLQLLDALEAVHDADVVHRDVKPANLLLEHTGTGEPVLRLADFGIAVSRDDPRLTRASDVLHTPGYTAPEVMGGADPDPRQDLFAAGMVMTELLTGVRPDPAAPPEPVGGELATVRARLVATDPLARYLTAAQARADLEAVPVVPQDDDVEVFDHLPALPQGWTAEGPAAGATSVVPATPAPGVAVAAEVAAPGRRERPFARDAVGSQRVLAAALAVGGVLLLVVAVLVV